MKLKNYYNLYKNYLFTFLSYTGIILYFGIHNGLTSNVFYIIFIYPLFIFFNKNNSNIGKNKKKLVFYFSVIITLLLSIGNIVNKNLYSKEIINLKNIIISLIMSLCLFPLILKINCFILKKTEKIKIQGKKINNSKKSFFYFSFIFIILCYLPFLWRYYPAKMTTDSFLQLSFIENGIKSDLHPFINTSFISFIYNIGKNLFHTNNAGVAFYIIVQIVIMSLIFSYAIYSLYKKNVKKNICLIILILYALMPNFSHYSVTLWKDVLFAHLLYS